MANLQNELYKMQKLMQQYQKDLETISNQNSKLEQEFENEINKKNEASKQHGQIIKAINNIYDMCIKQMHKKARYKNLDYKDSGEADGNLIEELTAQNQKSKTGPDPITNFIKKLEIIGETIEDLKEVSKLVPDFSKERLYAEEAAGTADQNSFKPLAAKNAKEN